MPSSCFHPLHRLLPLAAALAALTTAARAADLIEVLPLTNKIILLRFDDGKVVGHTAGQKLTQDVVTSSPLNVNEVKPTAFSVTSETAPEFSTAVAPTQVARKSKGTEYADVRDTWKADFGWVANSPYHAAEHNVYLVLPKAMTSGETYTISWNASALTTTLGSVKLVFREASARSEAIHVNALGYASDSPAKFGYLYHWMGDGGGLDLSAWQGKTFHLYNVNTGASAFTGTIAFRKAKTNAETIQNESPNKNFLGADAWECDFSAFKSPGVYRLVVPGIGASWPFRIAADAYRDAFHAVMRGIYQQRSGIALEWPYADENRPAPHNVKLTPGFANRLKYSPTRDVDIKSDGGGDADRAAVESGAKGNLTETWGWYQDAGDWDGYGSHQAVPTGLLTLYQLYPEKFIDGELTIPESGNGVPDVVDEGAWLLRCLHRLRTELVAKGWGTGGVGARIFGDYWGGDLLDQDGGTVGRGSWSDTTRDWYVTGEDPFATYRYAGGAAQMADILQKLGKTDPAGVDWAKEAREAYDWAGANVRAGDEAKAGGVLKHYRAYAATALYRLTGDETYHTALRTALADVSASTSVSHEDVRAMVFALYLTMDAARPVDAGLATRLKGALKTSAQNMTSSADSRAARWGGDFSFPMLVGQSSTPMISQAVLGWSALATADAAAAAKVYSVAHTTADYFLGTNPLNTVWISGVGPRHVRGHFNIDDRYTGPGLRRGIVPYGTWRFPDAWITLRMGFSIWWSWDTTYPSIDSRGVKQQRSGAAAPGSWPGHEAWFDNPLSPQTGEYTVWQNNLHAAITYGFLCRANPSLRSLAFVHGPVSTSAPAGGGASFYALVDASTNPAYQWRKNGVAVPGANTAVLQLQNVSAADAGAYTLVVTDQNGPVESAPATFTIADVPSSGGPLSSPNAKLVNLATRGKVETGGGVMIGGLVVTGDTKKRLLFRAVGPALADANAISRGEVLTDPKLTLYNSAGAEVYTNDNWGDDPSKAEATSVAASLGAFPFLANSKDAGFVRELDPGAYTVHVAGGDGGVGVALMEVFEVNADGTGGSRLINLATRGMVRPGSGVLIGGVGVTGGVQKLLFRAVGPNLSRAPYNLPTGDVLADPVLEVYSGSERIAVNDNWEDSPDASVVRQVAGSVGTPSYPSGSKDAAVVATLNPGAYTIIVSGANGTSGIALVEIFVVSG